MVEYPALSVSETIRSLDSSEDGLTDEESKKRLIEFGHNELQKENKHAALDIFAGQFKNTLILMLVFAGCLSLFLGEQIESIAIFCIVLLNAILGFIQEYKAEKAIEALEKISAPTANVLRDGKEQKIPARDVVPGDILLLEAGDIVPADSRIIKVSNLQADEASLTGESVPSKKVIDASDPGKTITEQKNMVFMGTVITYGRAKCIVTSTGMGTEFGKIAASLQTTKSVQTPLQAKFTQLAKQIGIIAVVLIMIVLVSGTLQGTLTFGRMILFALVLAVATIPSALPVIVTVGYQKARKILQGRTCLSRNFLQQKA